MKLKSLVSLISPVCRQPWRLAITYVAAEQWNLISALCFCWLQVISCWIKRTLRSLSGELKGANDKLNEL